MQVKEKTSNKTKYSALDRRTVTLVMVVGIIIAVLVSIFIIFGQPERSIASYCKVYKEERSRLAKLPGDTYPSGVFQDELSDAGAFADAFSKLEKVAPDEIRPDVKTLQGIYKKMADDPSQAIAASLSGASAEESVKKWTVDQCTN
jgi:hypothetical protein